MNVVLKFSSFVVVFMIVVNEMSRVLNIFLTYISKDILEKLDNEGIMLLSMSEIMRLKTHIQSQQQQQQQPQKQAQLTTTTTTSEQVDERLRAMAAENEKNQLILEIYKLRDLLADIKNLNIMMSGGGMGVDETVDWRSTLLKAISDIFLNQKEHLLAELRSFVSNNGFAHNANDYVAHLETKIDDLVQLDLFSYCN